MTYGVNAPLGLQTASYLGAAPFTGAIAKFQITPAYGTNLFIGDAVTLTNGLIVRDAPGTTPVLGVFQGCQYTDAQGNIQFSKYWPASTVVKTGTIALADISIDPNTEFTIQANTTVTTASIGKNANLTYATAGSAATGMSGAMLDVSTINTTATLAVHIVGFDPMPGNVSGVTYNNVLVKPNNSLFAAGATGV